MLESSLPARVQPEQILCGIPDAPWEGPQELWESFSEPLYLDKLPINRPRGRYVDWGCLRMVHRTRSPPSPASQLASHPQPHQPA